MSRKDNAGAPNFFCKFVYPSVADSRSAFDCVISISISGCCLYKCLEENALIFVSLLIKQYMAYSAQSGEVKPLRIPSNVKSNRFPNTYIGIPLAKNSRAKQASKGAS